MSTTTHTANPLAPVGGFLDEAAFTKEEQSKRTLHHTASDPTMSVRDYYQENAKAIVKSLNDKGIEATAHEDGTVRVTTGDETAQATTVTGTTPKTISLEVPQRMIHKRLGLMAAALDLYGPELARQVHEVQLAQKERENVALGRSVVQHRNQDAAERRAEKKAVGARKFKKTLKALRRKLKETGGDAAFAKDVL